MNKELRYSDVLKLAVILNFCSIIFFANKNFFLYDIVLFSRAIYISTLIIAGLVLVMNSNVVIIDKHWRIIILFLIGQICSFALRFFIGTISNDLNAHKIVLWVISLYIFLIYASVCHINYNEFEGILKILILLGVIAGFYNIFNNFELIIKVIQNPINYLTYRSSFRSFFNNKSTFAYFMLFASCATLYFASLGNKLYYLLYSFLFINIFLSNARSVVLVSLLVLFVFELRNGYVASAVFLGIIVWITINYLVNRVGQDTINITYLYHDSGEDITSGRINAWLTFFKNSHWSRILFGYGIDSMGDVLKVYSPGFALGSYHSAYVDAFCQGGVVYVIIQGYLIASRFFLVMKSLCRRELKVFLCTMIGAYAIVMVTDSIGSLMETQFWSLLSGAFIVGLPTVVTLSDYDDVFERIE